VPRSHSALPRRSPKLRAAQQGGCGSRSAAATQKKFTAILADMLKIWPNDAAVQNDEGYTRMLLDSNSRNDEARMTNDEKGRRAEGQFRLSAPSSISWLRPWPKAVAKNPRSMPHRTLLALVPIETKSRGRRASVYGT